VNSAVVRSAALSDRRRGTPAVALVLLAWSTAAIVFLGGGGQVRFFGAAAAAIPTAFLAPVLLLASPLLEDWPMLLAGGRGQGIALSGLMSALSIVWARRRSGRALVLSTGHLAMAAVAAVSIVSGFGDASVTTSYVILTTSSCIPMMLAGAAFPYDDAPIVLTIMAAICPLLVFVGVLNSTTINPISQANVAWIALYLLLENRRRLRFQIVVYLAILLSAYEWISTPQLGPRIAGAMALFFYFKRSRPSGTASRRSPLRLRVLVAIGVAMVGSIALRTAVRELQSASINNTNRRYDIWRGAFDGVTLFGKGIRPVTVAVGAKELTLHSHNFLLDALVASGVVGLLLLAFAIYQSLAGAWRSVHPMAPVCVGILVANLVSGGLFRAPNLWFAIGFLLVQRVGPLAASDGGFGRRRATTSIAATQPQP
jgi:hypothetical protein